MALVTQHLGFGITASTGFEHPYTFARRLSTADHLSKGRLGWNIVTSYLESGARNVGNDGLQRHDNRYDIADEYLEVIYKLLEGSWEDGAVLRDRTRRVFTDPSKVHEIKHFGKFFTVPGYHLCEPSPQRTPVLYQAGASGRGRDFAARWADVIFVTHASLESAQAFYADLKGRAVKFGRDPNAVKILPGIVPVLGETDAIAKEKDDLLSALADPVAGLSTLAYHLDIDLAAFPRDSVLPVMDVPGVAGHYNEVAELTRRKNLTLGQLGKQYGIGPMRDFVGTGGFVAQQMQTWFEAGGCDGFMIQTPSVPGGLEDFVRLVVPELQQAGLFRRDYGGPMLRDSLGLPRPAAFARIA
jgi:FMN-dependent oxidoreductase (nitrilotriacetate monooxygenase family)